MTTLGIIITLCLSVVIALPIVVWIETRRKPRVDYVRIHELEYELGLREDAPLGSVQWHIDARRKLYRRPVNPSSGEYRRQQAVRAEMSRITGAD